MLARIESAVLISGEAGVGKDEIARAIHAHGSRSSGPFVAVDCGTLREELPENGCSSRCDGVVALTGRARLPQKIVAARSGTLFLNDIAALPLELQPYLLRALAGVEAYSSGAYVRSRRRIRLIAACKGDLREEVRKRRFRRDLFFRVSVAPLQIPPLRERPEDLPLLVAHFSAVVAQRLGSAPKRFSSDVLQVFRSHAWPGNLRELRDVVEAMVMLTDGDEVGLGTLPPEALGVFRPHGA